MAREPTAFDGSSDLEQSASSIVQGRAPTAGAPALPALVGVWITDRHPGGLHARCQLYDGTRRAVFVPHGAVAAARAGGAVDREAVVPTDAGPPLGLIAADILTALAGRGPIESGPIAEDRDPPPEALGVASPADAPAGADGWILVGIAVAACVALGAVLMAVAISVVR